MCSDLNSWPTSAFPPGVASTKGNLSALFIGRLINRLLVLKGLKKKGVKMLNIFECIN